MGFYIQYNVSVDLKLSQNPAFLYNELYRPNPHFTISFRWREYLFALSSCLIPTLLIQYATSMHKKCNAMISVAFYDFCLRTPVNLTSQCVKIQWSEYLLLVDNGVFCPLFVCHSLTSPTAETEAHIWSGFCLFISARPNVVNFELCVGGGFWMSLLFLGEKWFVVYDDFIL